MLLYVVCFIVTFIIGVKIYLKSTTGICKCKNRLDGKTVLITGANTGIGKETALDLARRGARVILACRDMKKANAARDEIIADSGNKEVIVRKLDLASLDSVREFCKDFLASESKLDVLINNAGAVGLGNKKTKDGLLAIMHVNHFGPFLLTNLLLDLLKKSSPSRIVFVASMNHKWGFNFNLDKLNSNDWCSWHQDYNCSKLANVLTSNELARRLKGTGVTVNSLHPGVIYTDIWRWLPSFILIPVDFTMNFLCKDIVEGAQTTIHVAVSKKLEGVTGKYFVDCKETPPSIVAQDMDLARKVWERSEELVNLKKKKK